MKHAEAGQSLARLGVIFFVVLIVVGTYAVMRAVRDSACGSMVLRPLLCAIFLREAQKNGAP